MRSSFHSSRNLRVDTQPPFPPRSPSSIKSPTTPNIKGFMKSTASSVRKVSPRTLNLSPDSKTMDHGDTSEKLMQDLIRFTRSSDRRMLIRTLRECSMLHNIPVDEATYTADYPKTNHGWKELEQDVVASIPIELNNIQMGSKVSNEKEKRQEGEKLLQMLPLLCNKLVQSMRANDNQQTKRLSSDELYQLLLLRFSSKRNTSMIFAKVNQLIGSKELMLQIPKKPIKPVPEPKVMVYSSDGAVHAITEHACPIGLFRKSDSAGRPWIGLTAVYRERVNLSDPGQYVRRISLQIHEEKVAVY